MITRDRRAQLMRSLDRLTALPEDPMVVVVDNGSRDATPSAVRRSHPGVRVLPLAANAGVAGRNLGLQWANSQYVAFADDDSWWRPGSLAAAVEVMEGDPGVALVAGRIVVGPGERPDPVSEAMAAGPLGPDLAPAAGRRRAVAGCLACACVVRRRAFLAAGGFPADFTIGGEEQTLVWDLWAAGWRAVYVPAAVAVHHPAGAPDSRAGRHRLVARNDLWAAWSRLPAASALTRTAAVMKRAGRDPAQWRGVAEAFGRAGWALSRRAPVPARVDRIRQLLT